MEKKASTVSHMPRSVSFLAVRVGRGMSLLVRNLFRSPWAQGTAALSLVLLSSHIWGATYTINVTISSPTLAGDFIASATSQYAGVLKPSPYFANTWSLIVSSKTMNYVPPVISSPIPTATAVDQCMAYGFGTGMDAERYQATNTLQSMQYVDYSSRTCGGYKITPTTSTVNISSNTALGLCLGVYNVIISTLQQRWGYVYEYPTGTKVAP
jgi:hypothetical protein